MRLQHVIQAVYHSPWLITAAGHAAVRRLVETKLRADDGDSVAIVMENPRRAACLDPNGIGHIHLCGVIGHRLSAIEKSCGNTDVCEVRRELDALLAEGARGILLHVDSSGGTVAGVPELAASLADAAEIVPLYAWTDTIAGSAAYWLLAAAHQAWCAPSAEVGSIGIIFPWVDQGARWEMEGLAFAPITNEEAIYKSAGHGPTLTEEQVALLQEQIQSLFARFQGFVMERRPLADADAMRGQCFIGFDAVGAGLVDHLGEFSDCYLDLCAASGVCASVIPDFFAPPDSSDHPG